MKKMLIWSSENEFDEDFREELVLAHKEKFGEDYEPSEEEIDEDLAELNGIYLEDENGAEWYGDGYNIRGNFSHHDGSNHVLYRVAKDMVEAEKIAEKIYNEEMDEEQFRRRTRSLYPYVAKVYGWEIKWGKRV